ncbi:MAG: glycerate kinase, partial [Prevotella sp.]|nr:glycerate kinase [Prevotella sp.]
MGKVPHGVQKRCLRAGVEVWLLSGAIDDPESVLSRHFSKVKSINENDSHALAQLLLPEVATENLRKTVKSCMK